MNLLINMINQNYKFKFYKKWHSSRNLAMTIY